ncbi:phosphonatase-like hydrolase [Gordonia shandongensis]|uniref:phosphonatase-like hydrolase n=1 Tax=Gordonia shandongensis TaxID=376351 RepID=UPI0003F999B4|nr:phosphonatase-like hydrolase [Gordonia shandongensis]
MITLAAFDIAGTTVDDGGAVYDALRACVEEVGANVADGDLAHWMGTDKVTAIANLARLGGVELDDGQARSAFVRFREILAERYRTEPPTPVPGAAQTVTRLQNGGVKVALTTGFDRAVVEPLLESLNWGVAGSAAADSHHEVVFDTVVTTDDVAAGRPAPDMIRLAMQRCGVTAADQVIAAGDTAVDVQAANNAGAVSVGVLTGQTPRATLEDNAADHVLDSIASIPDLPGVLDSSARHSEASAAVQPAADARG